MYTHCPECNTAFRITTVQLRMGQGRVKCSKCGSLFDAISSLSDVAFEDHFSDLRKLPTLPLEQALSPPVDRERTEKSATAPHWHGSRSLLGRRRWLSGIAILFALLITQLSVFEGERLVQHPDFRPWLEDLCAFIDFELPSYRDPGAIEVLERSLEPVGRDALEFRVVLINGSRFQQAFPRLELDLIKLNGTPLARRIFFPEEYFSDQASLP
ncbi:MAG: zinc-ribbon and DUF3426 domain-containing protein, partial [Methylococcales bacterium]